MHIAYLGSIKIIIYILYGDFQRATVDSVDLLQHVNRILGPSSVDKVPRRFIQLEEENAADKHNGRLGERRVVSIGDGLGHQHAIIDTLTVRVKKRNMYFQPVFWATISQGGLSVAPGSFSGQE